MNLTDKNQNQTQQSGLVNLGNTCFMNSTLQCLLNTDYLSDTQKKNKCQRFCFFCEFQSLKTESIQRKVTSPNTIAKNLKNLSRSFRLGQQEDAHEFFRLFLERMSHTEFKESQTLIEKTFGLEIYSRVNNFNQITCQNCQYKSQIQEKYLDLSLEINKSNSIFESMNNFFQVETLDGKNKYKCSQCNRLVVAKKQFLIKQAPQNFVIHLKRFTNHSQKINKKINFPTFLNLNRYTDNQLSTKYELYGIVVHQGHSSYSGHYYSYIKKGNQWMVMNDEFTKKVEENQITKENPYILFYRQINNQQAQVPQQIKIEQNQQIIEQRHIEKNQQKQESQIYFKQISNTKELSSNSQQSDKSTNSQENSIKTKDQKEKKNEIIYLQTVKDNYILQKKINNLNLKRKISNLERLQTFNNILKKKKFNESIIFA